MILQQQNDPQIAIRQTDHAMLAGFFARLWGNELFSAIEPRASFCLAAAEHDNGWQEWELQPSIDPRTFLPHTFMTIPTAEHIALYQRGIDRVVKTDLYAGLLVVDHCMRLYDRARATMPGYSSKYVKSEEQQIANDFVQRLRMQQLRLKSDLRNDAATRPYAEESCFKANSQRMDALDRLSLYFCLGNFEEASIEGVPVNDQGKEADLELRPAESGVFTIDPYPFRRDPMEFSILARRIPKRRYTENVDLQRALSAAAFFNLHYKLRSRTAADHAFAISA